MQEGSELNIPSLSLAWIKIIIFYYNPACMLMMNERLDVQLKFQRPRILDENKTPKDPYTCGHNRNSPKVDLNS